MKSTPGPWEIKTVNTSVGHCHKIMPLGACLYVDNQTLPRDSVNTASVVALANAHLIAAAPDLLQELKNIANACYREWDNPDDFQAWAQSRAKFAIAKVEGK